MINLLAFVLTVSWCLLLLNREYISDQFLNQILCLFSSLCIHVFSMAGENDECFIYLGIYHFMLRVRSWSRLVRSLKTVFVKELSFDNSCVFFLRKVSELST